MFFTPHLDENAKGVGLLIYGGTITIEDACHQQNMHEEDFDI